MSALRLDLLTVIPLMRQINKSQLEDDPSQNILIQLLLKRYVPKVNNVSQLATTLLILFCTMYTKPVLLWTLLNTRIKNSLKSEKTQNVQTCSSKTLQINGKCHPHWLIGFDWWERITAFFFSEASLKWPFGIKIKQAAALSFGEYFNVQPVTQA